MVRQLILTLLFSLLFTGTPFCCSCIYIPSFCETVTFDDTIYSDLVIMGEIINKNGVGMNVRILDKFYGKETANEIFVRGGNGADCGDDLWHFEAGQQVILNLYDHYLSQEQNDNIYWLSICGINYLHVNNNKVEGPIAPGVSQLDYLDFRRGTYCPSFSKYGRGIFSLVIDVFPNPSYQQDVTIKVNEEVESLEWKLVDLFGRVISSGIRRELEANESFTLELTKLNLANGIYFTYFTYEDNIHQTFKLLIR
ncbi:MAG: T9SS type A sorting domain-containing protein [Bacteroidota bacterium]